MEYNPILYAIDSVLYVISKMRSVYVFTWLDAGGNLNQITMLDIMNVWFMLSVIKFAFYILTGVDEEKE